MIINNVNIITDITNGQSSAYVDTWMGQIRVPIKREGHYISLLPGFDYDIYSFKDRLVIL